MSEQEASLGEFAASRDEDDDSGPWEIVKLSEITRKRAENVDPQEVDLDRHVGLEHISPNTPDPDWEPVGGLSSTKRRFEPGDILFAKLRPNLEKAAQPDFSGIASTDIFPIVAEEGINSKYLLYRLSSKSAFDHARRTSVGTRMPRTSWNLFGNFEFGLPSLEEQHNIASALSTVDQAIQRTEGIIEQYRRLYSGVLQSVFDDHPGEDTKKAGRLGEVPISWDDVTLSEVADVTMGNSPKSKYYNSKGNGFPFYQGADEFGERSPTPDRWCSNPKKTAQPEDTLLNIRSHTNVGKVNQATHECCIGRGLAAITPRDGVDADFLYHHLRERENYVNAIASGSTFDSVNSKEVETLKIVLPPIDEQNQIASALNDIQDLILQEKRTNEQLNLVKQGLMQDLLSGEVRTHDKDIEIVDEVLQHG